MARGPTLTRHDQQRKPKMPRKIWNVGSVVQNKVRSKWKYLSNLKVWSAFYFLESYLQLARGVSMFEQSSRKLVIWHNYNHREYWNENSELRCPENWMFTSCDFNLYDNLNTANMSKLLSLNRLRSVNAVNLWFFPQSSNYANSCLCYYNKSICDNIPDRGHFSRFHWA